MSNDIPTATEISPTQGLNLDEKQAIEHFFGKTLDEAEALFREHAIYYAEDLMWMGDKGFRFYFQAFCRFLESVHSEGGADALNSLISLLEFRIEYEPQSILRAKETILSILDHCVKHYLKFEIRAEIYGDLRTKLLQLQKIVRELNPTGPPNGE